MYKKLYKSRYNVKFDGVCGGLAEYLNIDPTLVRIIWAVLSFFTAFIGGIVLYFLCSVIIPRDPGAGNPSDQY